MRFLIDEDLPRSTANLLRQAGYETVDVRDVGLRGAKDEDILAFACEKAAAVVTADVGFASLPATTSLKHWGFILLRAPNDFSIAQINELLLRSLCLLSEEDIVGNIVVIQPQRLRIRRRRRQ